MVANYVGASGSGPVLQCVADYRREEEDVLLHAAGQRDLQLLLRAAIYGRARLLWKHDNDRRQLLWRAAEDREFVSVRHWAAGILSTEWVCIHGPVRASVHDGDGWGVAVAEGSQRD